VCNIATKLVKSVVLVVVGAGLVLSAALQKKLTGSAINVKN